jgi:AraC family transcriptional regulator
MPTRTLQMTGLDEFSALAQRDGGLPTTLATGSAPGESGVRVLSQRFEGGLHASGTPRQHHVCFQMSPLRIERRMAGRALRHAAREGGLAICPAGVDFAADAEESVALLLVAIDPSRLLLAAAENATLEAQLMGQLSGYDKTLFDSARVLAFESAARYPNGPLFWNELAGRFIDHLVARYLSVPRSVARGRLGKEVLDRLKVYIVEHLHEPIEVTTLAAIAGRSPFHFSRVFTRSVGITPHRYVVRLRLQRAVELVREGRSSLADIASRTGFADQSHLSRWVRRVHGVPLTQLPA